MGVNDRKISTDSPNPKREVGEIDTSAPFQSVKDALSLFGAGAFSGEKPAIKKVKPHSAERVLAKETQLHLAEKELNKLKELLKNAETTKVETLMELEKAKRTVEDLNCKLKFVIESKESAIKITEDAKSQAKQFVEANGSKVGEIEGSRKQDMDTARDQYMVAISELDAAKQELRKIRQESDASLEAKVTALKQTAEAEAAAKVHKERANDLSRDILVVQDSIEQLKLASFQAQKKQEMLIAEKNAQRQSNKVNVEKSGEKLHALKKEFDPKDIENLESQLTETMNEIGILQKKMEDSKALDLDSVRAVTVELDDAKESLHKVAEEERSLRSSVEALKMELEAVKKDHAELKEKETETESIAGNLHVKLRKSKLELESFIEEESKTRGACEEMILTLNQLSSETANARREADEMKTKAEELKKEAQSTKIALEEAEKTLRVALEEAEEAKVAEVKALDQIKILSETTNAARASISESGAKITISREEFESLSRKVGESDTLTEMKVAAALAQVEAVKASENEALKKLETIQKEIEEMKGATNEALKRADMAEAAKRAVEGELRRWREREQKKAAETASQILTATEIPSESSSQLYKIQTQSSPLKIMDTQKLEKEKTFSKKALLPNLSGIFQRKKNQVDGGSPSYLPGEKPM